MSPVRDLSGHFRMLLVTDPETGRQLGACLQCEQLDVVLNLDPAALEQQLLTDPGFDLLVFDLDLVEAWQSRQDDLPVILLGSAGRALPLAELLSQPVADFLVKPVVELSFCLKVRALLKQIELNRALEAQKNRLEHYLEMWRGEAEMASYIFYNNLMDLDSDKIDGFSRQLCSSSDFCGDLVLVRFSSSGSIFVLHVDAMGHGLSATITLLPVVDSFCSMVEKGYALPMIVREINNRLHLKLPPDRFVAASVVEVDLLHEQVSVWNGGMPPLYLLDERSQIQQVFVSTHMALGILDNIGFDASVVRFELPRGGGIFGCSDGLADQVNAEGEAYSNSRLVEHLTGLSRHFLLSGLMADLKSFSGLPRFDDDISLFYLDFRDLVQFFDQQRREGHPLREHDTIDPFSWELCLKGRQIAEQEVAVRCNELLQDMGLSQPFCQRVFTVISELSNNAVDHGILGLASSLKNLDDGFAEYYVQRDRLMCRLQPEDRLRVRLEWFRSDSGSRLLIEVEQSGEGFDAERVLQQKPQELTGRGLMLIRRLASNLEFRKEGRLARALLE